MSAVLFLALIATALTAGALITRRAEKRWQDPRVGRFR